MDAHFAELRHIPNVICLQDHQPGRACPRPSSCYTAQKTVPWKKDLSQSLLLCGTFLLLLQPLVKMLTLGGLSTPTFLTIIQPLIIASSGLGWKK